VATLPGAPGVVARGAARRTPASRTGGLVRDPSGSGRASRVGHAGAPSAHGWRWRRSEIVCTCWL